MRRIVGNENKDSDATKRHRKLKKLNSLEGWPEPRCSVFLLPFSVPVLSYSGRLSLPHFRYPLLNLVEQLITETHDFEDFDDREKRCGQVCLDGVFEHHWCRLFHGVPDELGGVAAEESQLRRQFPK